MTGMLLDSMSLLALGLLCGLMCTTPRNAEQMDTIADAALALLALIVISFMPSGIHAYVHGLQSSHSPGANN